MCKSISGKNRKVPVIFSVEETAQAGKMMKACDFCWKNDDGTLFINESGDLKALLKIVK